MDEIKLPQHFVNRIDRRWTTRFAQMPDVRSTDVAIARKRRPLSRSRYLASIGRVIECARWSIEPSSALELPRAANDDARPRAGQPGTAPEVAGIRFVA